MAKYIGSACRLCRREGVKLFIKGSHCVTGKCSLDRRAYKPGQHAQQRTKLSDYGLQLREKQKAKRIYGVLERQFRNYFKKAERARGVTGEVLLQLLERRLDNAVFRCCFAASRPQARQMVNHGLITVNGRKVDISSYTVNQGDIIEISAKEKTIKALKEQIEDFKARGVPEWLQLDKAILKATVIGLPEKKDVGFLIQEQLIVELYSK